MCKSISFNDVKQELEVQVSTKNTEIICKKRFINNFVNFICWVLNKRFIRSDELRNAVCEIPTKKSRSLTNVEQNAGLYEINAFVKTIF